MQTFTWERSVSQAPTLLKGHLYLRASLVLYGMVAHLCLTLCDPMDCSPPGSSVHGIFQARVLEWLLLPPPENLPYPGIEPVSVMSPALACGFFTPSATWEVYLYTWWFGGLVAKSCLTLATP